MLVELKTKAGKLPVIDRVRTLLVEHVIPVLLEDREQFYPGNGTNITIGQDAFNCELTNDDGTPAGRVMFSWSPNIWGPKVEGQKNGKAPKDADDRITLTSKENAALDSAINAAKGANDIDVAVRLATIKSVAAQSGGKVSRDDFRVVTALAS